MTERNKRIRIAWKGTALLLLFCLATTACSGPVPDNTSASSVPTPAPTTTVSPSPTPTLTPAPSPTPIPDPILPGRTEMPSSVLDPELRQVTMTPEVFDAQHQERGWIRKDRVILLSGHRAAEDSALTEGITLGDPVDGLIRLLGTPLVRNGQYRAWIFTDLVFMISGADRIQSAALVRYDRPEALNAGLLNLSRLLQEEAAVLSDSAPAPLPSRDSSLQLMYVADETPFFAVYPTGDRTQWVSVRTGSREHYWVNGHAFLTLGREKPRPVCYAVSFSGDTAVRAFPLTDIQELDPEIRIDMKYASEDNFVHENLYGDLTRVYMHSEAAERVARAHAALREDHPNLRFLIYDSYRPISAQQRMWDLVQGTEFEAILSDPAAWFSNHYVGLAVDMTLYDTETGEELDMGTEFDSFARMAWPRYELEFLDTGELSREAYQNRLLMRKYMEAEGFTQLYFEWWQFDLHLGLDNLFR